METIESLIVANSRLTRTAAQATGSTVSSPTWTALAVLISDGPHRIGDLARAARISQPGMTKILQTLVIDEWVLRIADVDDSRAWLIAITDKGRAALAHWRAELAVSMGALFADLGDTEWQTLTRAAEILAAHTSSPTASPLNRKEDAA